MYFYFPALTLDLVVRVVFLSMTCSLEDKTCSLKVFVDSHLTVYVSVGRSYATSLAAVATDDDESPESHITTVLRVNVG